MRLDNEEINAVFNTLDLNGDRSVDYRELVETFATINTEQIIKRIQKVVVSSKMDPEFYFSRYSGTEGSSNKLSKNEFKRMVKELYSKVTTYEFDHVYKHFDRGNKGYISKDDFLSAFTT